VPIMITNIIQVNIQLFLRSIGSRTNCLWSVLGSELQFSNLLVITEWCDGDEITLRESLETT